MGFRQHTPYRLPTTMAAMGSDSIALGEFGQSEAIESDPIEIYTDGAYFKQHHLGGWGVAIYRNGSLIQTLNGVQTSYSSLEMELIAAIQALQWTQKHQPKVAIALYTDAQILLEGLFDKYPNWLANDWRSAKGNPVAYAARWQQLYALAQTQHLDFYWIKGHAKHPQNELVDRLAREPILRLHI